MRKAIYCYAEGRPGEWEAICLSFDIAVHGQSFEEVRSKLFDAIHLYIEKINELPANEQRALLNRRAPIRLWLRFCYHVIRSLFRGRHSGGDKERAEFTLACPA